jgi:hypothetical protein
MMMLPLLKPALTVKALMKQRKDQHIAEQTTAKLPLMLEN